MEKKNIIIIAAIGVLIILAAAWFIFDPFGSKEVKVAESRVAPQQAQPVPDTAKQKKAEKPKEKKNEKQNTEDAIYVVKEGDTLQKISVNFYGDTKHWLDIFAANEPNIDWYDVIRPGQKLLIPETEKK